MFQVTLYLLLYGQIIHVIKSFFCHLQHSRLYIPPGFYNGFLCLEPSTYCYHLGYSGHYIDAQDQSTLSLEDSCVPLSEISSHYSIDNIIRSERDC